ncbi:neutral/alkaline non-lysosomal ceramidase N-terminal domain-containing protein [Algoriphagus sp. H41]|uniref:Neutral/alkaline non-lysosomal ceramidase N-terminal domain-containing protein n=1 Tax=Algoriphagus oliviformis TaxID=2811231 RepID=A0ABS3BXM9_9BACT|nr:neutral/alkaline non-lysosomal ceramidase N-terminal domain-containing protein [Algoriphagus oliviformis]MBN7809432.1 neutral/alkaline non-lysosomal ceramidase N-terminal domain-containing protein [Algoriphagus oliviformis]
MQKDSQAFVTKSFKKALQIFLGAFLFLFLLVALLITRVDRSPLEGQNFYRKTFDRLEKTPWQGSEGEAWLAGWAKANVTPPQAVDLVGYAPRGPYEFVLDSSYVKALSLSNGKTHIAWLNFELLIVHPELAKAVEKGIIEAKIPVDQLIFTATHTHSGMGGYMPGPLGEIAFGGYDQKVVDLLVEKSVAALQTAIQTQDTVVLSFQKSEAADLVANRFVEDGPTDPFVRQLLFTKKNGRKAIFLTYSAHATCLNSKFMGLSGDYPKYLSEALEAEQYDFAIFAAGTVGSHRPLAPGNSPEQVQEYALMLDSALAEKTTTDTLANPRIAYSRLDLGLRSPHLRISDNLRIRPWLFDYLLGETNPHLDITQIGNLLMIASSGELSGVFYEEWERVAEQNKLQLIVTTFNGGYIGYITPDELYDERFHEVREMNWYGPGNGSYFDKLIKRTIEKAN